MEWELAAISASCDVCGDEWKGDVAAGEASCQAALARWFQAHDHDVDGVRTLLAKVNISKVARRTVERVNVSLTLPGDDDKIGGGQGTEAEGSSDPSVEASLGAAPTPGASLAAQDEQGAS